MTDLALHFQRLGMTAADAASRAELFARLDRAAPPILEGPADSHRFTPGRIGKGELLFVRAASFGQVVRNGTFGLAPGPFARAAGLVDLARCA